MLYVVTATLNAIAHTQRLIAALSAVSDSTRLRMVVVDNQSADGTLDWLTSLRANLNGKEIPLVPGAITVLANQRNLGAAAAWNQGIRFAINNGAEAILVCGNDTIPMPGCVERLYDHIKRGMAFVSGTAVSYDAAEVMVPLAQQAEPLVAAPDFSMFCISPRCIELVARWDISMDFERVLQARQAGQTTPSLQMNPWEYGLFDSRFWPGYFEDNDYHLRCHSAGALCLRDPGAIFRHDTSATIRNNPQVAQVNSETFRNNAELYRAKWGRLPAEMGLAYARPLNVTDQQWEAMSGGHPVQEVDQGAAIEAARATYAQYGIVVEEAIA